MSGPMVVEIADPDDPRIADYRHLTDVELRTRVESPAGLFIAEGYLVIEKVIERGLRIRSALVEPRRVDRLLGILESAGLDTVIYCAPHQVLESITGYRVHRGVLACVDRPDVMTVDDLINRTGDLIALEGLVDPTNVGLALRSAAALGIEAAIVSPDCADPFYRRAVRTSMGASLTLPLARSHDWPGDLDRLRAGGYHVMALSPDPAGLALEQAVDRARTRAHRILALFGTEGDGLRPDTLDRVDQRVFIPMAAGIDSLNVAAAVAVVAYALR